MFDHITTAVALRACRSMESTLAMLSHYVAHPAISCEEEHHSDVIKLAQAIANDLCELGLDSVRLLQLDGALPLVAASYSKQPGKPTLLIYGHYDLQPVQNEAWDTPPHKLTKRGDRVYARGASDDMGGWLSHLAAIRAWLEETGELPLNIKLVIEGEEEIGSPNLERYIEAFPEAFSADFMVLTDCENPSVDIPGLTVSLRGLMEIELTCEALTADVHSGLWGNLLPDPALALVSLLARLVDEDTRLRIGRIDVSENWRKESQKIPFDEALIRKGGRLLSSVLPLPERGRSRAEWVWRQPAITILSTSLPKPGEEKNAIRHKASAILSLRIPPGCTPQALFEEISKTLTSSPPGGVQVTVKLKELSALPWIDDPKGPVYDAVDRAYLKGWGHPPLRIGVGGSIPFVAIFAKRFPHVPLILNGVMDPESGAHGPNESLHLGLFERAIRANAYLYAELASLNPTSPSGI
ncbi:MAG: M20/M25/M40 family metallo-hydrolase [Sandaracinaceae bacterium]|nr:M20/M25/M40 family metallo-hydrolase [Sandaracinaceae bacterium]